MNTPESISVALDWANALEAVGFPQDDSALIWCGCNPKHESFVWQRRNNEVCGGWDLAAPTAEEILRRLPNHLVALMKDNRSPTLRFRRLDTHAGDGSRWCLGYDIGHDNYLGGFSTEEDTLANAAAAMYCYLAEQKLLPPQV
jgi:hypothetical protein